MTVHTTLEICNQDGKVLCRYQTKSFTGETKKKDIDTFTLNKLKNFNYPFDTEIFDQRGGYVTLDDEYLEEYKPFVAEEIDATTTVQPAKSLEQKVMIRVILLDHNHHVTNNQHDMPLEKLIEMSEAAAKQNEQMQQFDHGVSTLQASKDSTIYLSKDPKMGFVEIHNVNDKQRDQYICDQVNVNTGLITGTLSMIQGEKTENNKYKSVLPQFRIWHDGIIKRDNHAWTLLVFIVLDVCHLGKRSLFYHPQRTFVEKKDITQQLNPYEIPIKHDNWTNNMGMELKLIVVVIEGAKKHSNATPNIICNLEDIDGNQLPITYNDSKTRLALVLRKDNIIQWETLVLSKEMFFKDKNKTGVRNIPNFSTNITSTTLKRRGSKKYQNISNKRSKSTIKEDFSSNIQSCTNNLANNNSSNVFNSNLPIYYTNSQTMPNVLTNSPEVVLNESQIGNEDEIQPNIINILHYDPMLSDSTSIDTFWTSNDDSLFNDANFIGIDLLNP